MNPTVVRLKRVLAWTTLITLVVLVCTAVWSLNRPSGPPGIFYGVDPRFYEPEGRIRGVLEIWPNAIERKDKQAVYSLFAADLVASFPGQPDRDYEAMCKHLAASLDHPTKTFRYDAPAIKEILVSGDLAVVRLIWTLHVIDQKTKDEVIAREIGVDVFKRQKDGSWRISISHAFPEEGDRK